MRVLWIGLGKFGRPMAESLLRAGHDVLLPATGHAQRATEDLLEVGAAQLHDRDVPDVCGLCLPTPADVDDALAGLVSDRVGHVVDFSTGHPAAARATAAALAARGISYVDAPVSGSVEAARRGELTIWAGTSPTQVSASARELLEALSTHLFYLGGIGQGAAMKLCNQVVHIVTMAAIGEGVSLARAIGVDPRLAIESMTTSSADSAMLRRFGPSLVADDHAPAFALSLAAKDVELAADLSDQFGLDLAHLALVRNALRERLERGYGSWNFSAVGVPIARLEQVPGDGEDSS